MDTQSVLNLMIQAVVMGIAALMVFDFVSGLWVVPLPPASWQPPIIEQSTVCVTAPQPNPQEESPHATPLVPQFEEIPDPWTNEPQSPHHVVSAPSSVIIPFPTLRLLPPAIAQKVQPTKPKRTKAKAKSDTSAKSASTPKRQSTKSRKITA
ncbi:hypothetical protein NIES23_62270 (plasmid) [Trichormus variabilis NIES-23]|uniref:Uncharacterized protein n=1 Tax=Trichormus variabilis NIES-23 TaxID=1973479 RepID=A0A1Z4KWR7_ANAVA|nr:hypothetical protein NIES23_62270 [Trichormus variabilis NIES-23]